MERVPLGLERRLLVAVEMLHQLVEASVELSKERLYHLSLSARGDLDHARGSCLALSPSLDDPSWVIP